MTSQTADRPFATINGERNYCRKIERIRARFSQNWRLFVSDDCSTNGDGARSIDAWRVGGGNAEQIHNSLHDGIAAIIVSYKPDLNRLDENLRAVSLQVDAVFVYCNDAGKTPCLPEFLDARNCVYFIDDKNSGLSHALNEGCKAAEAFGASYVLLLDQDSIPGDNMVEGLRSCFSSNVALVSPQIVDRNMHEGASPKCDVVSIKRAITSGALVSLSVWRYVGGFDERLFVDWVDYEFSCNLRSHNYILLRNNSVTLLHEMGHKEYFATAPSFFGGKAFYRTNHSKLRLRDKARSWTITRNKYAHTKAGFEEQLYIAEITIRDLIIERNRLGTLKAFVLGSRDGRELLKSQYGSRRW